MVAAFAWAYSVTNPNISDRLLSVRVPIRKRSGTQKKSRLQQTQQQVRTRGQASKGQASEGQASGAEHAETWDVAFEKPVSGFLLASRSEYFRRKLEEYQTPGDPLVVHVEAGEEDLFRALIKHMYFEKLETTEETTLLQLLLLAQKYLLLDCVRDCVKALSQIEKLAVTTAVQICEVAEQQECSGMPATLVNRATACLLETFKNLDTVWDDASLRDSFLELPLPAVKVLLGHDKLQVRHENTVFAAVSWWLLHRPEERTPHFGTLQTLLCWGEMSGAFLVAIFQEVQRPYPQVRQIGMWRLTKDNCVPIWQVPFLKNWSGVARLWGEVSGYKMVNSPCPFEIWNQLSCRKHRQYAHGSAKVKVPISAVQVLDGPSPTKRKVHLPQEPSVAGHAVSMHIIMQATNDDKHPSALGLFIRPAIQYGSADMLEASPSAPVAFSGQLMAKQGQSDETFHLSYMVLQDASFCGFPRFFCNAVHPDVAGTRSATQALRESGFVHDDSLELSFDITFH